MNTTVFFLVVVLCVVCVAVSERTGKSEACQRHVERRSHNRIQIHFQIGGSTCCRSSFRYYCSRVQYIQCVHKISVALRTL